MWGAWVRSLSGSRNNDRGVGAQQLAYRLGCLASLWAWLGREILLPLSFPV